jgi:hypothetical protein
MNYRLINSRYISGFVIWVRFSDGCEGEIDLENELYGSVFEPLKGPEFFKRFSLDPELHTLVWPNGADFSPEFLHEMVQKTLAA